MFNLSVVNIIPDAHKDAVNAIAELYGCGENNLGVRLIGADGIYWAVTLGGNLKIMLCFQMQN